MSLGLPLSRRPGVGRHAAPPGAADRALEGRVPPPVQRIADRVSGWLNPVVLCGAGVSPFLIACRPDGAQVMGAEWLVDTHEGSTARLEQRTGGGLSVQWIDVKSPVVWHVQLRHPGVVLEAGERYVLRFTARSAAPRTIDYAVTQAYDPWQPLGLYTQATLFTYWDDFQGMFTPVVSDSNAQVVFNLGAAASSVELANITLAAASTGAVILRGGETSDTVITRAAARNRLEQQRGSAETRAR